MIHITNLTILMAW